MFDFAYVRGGCPVYPSLQGDAGLARTLYLPGVHYVDSNPSFHQIPLVTEMDNLQLNAEWPPYNALPLIDMYCEHANRTIYAEKGRQFVEHIGTLGPPYDELAGRWRFPE
jgi:hypothetical protein